MKTIIYALLLLFGVTTTYAQISNAQEEFVLPAGLRESSGAIMLNGKLVTHNDSGGQNALYELDVNSKSVTRTVTVTNAINIDWEDIAQDETHIYIGDIGNNNGTRTDLKIYKISKSDYLSSENVSAEIIAYSYSDQNDFTSNPNNTIWDAEALISFDANNLIVFTKNWVDNVTKGYVIPKTQGTHIVSSLTTTLSSEGLITGATFNPATKKLYLIGYNNVLQPFVWDCENFNLNDIFSGTNTKTLLENFGQEQAEAITHTGANNYLLTSESFSISMGPFNASDDAKLMSFSTNDITLSNTLFRDSTMLAWYPNPAHQFINIDIPEMVSVEIFNTQSKQLYSGNTPLIDVSRFSNGVYIVKVHLTSNRVLIRKLIKK